MKAVRIVQKPGTEIKWAGDDIVGVAAIDESTAEDAVRAIKVQYEVLPPCDRCCSATAGAPEESTPLSTSDCAIC